MQRVTHATKPLVSQYQGHGWLLRQSLYTHFQRLFILRGLGEISGPILDVGAGTGSFSLDLAWHSISDTPITALDPDTQALDILSRLAGSLGLQLALIVGDGQALPIQSASQNLTVARYVFQHLSSPRTVLSEMYRVTRPGGRILIIDVDDGLSLGYPEAPPSLQALRKAVRIYQAHHGGNRLVGRTLYNLMREAGLKDIHVMLMPRFRLGLQQPRNTDMESHQMKRLIGEREALIEDGLIEPEEFTRGIAALADGFSQDRFEVEADFIVTARVP